MDKIYEIYNTGNSVVMLTTEQHLYDIMMDEHHKGVVLQETIPNGRYLHLRQYGPRSQAFP